MAKIKVKNLIKKSGGDEVILPDNIFGVKINNDLLFQVILSLISNRRVATAKTKTRAERRGGGKKPWRQKGTGRARTGSLRSPIFRKGGIVFGPNPKRNYKRKINKKMKRKAFLMVLSSKLRDKEIIIVEGLKVDKIKTKDLAKKLERLKLNKKSALIVLGKKDEKIEKSARNIKNINLKTARNLNILDIVENKWFITEKEALDVIKKNYQK